MRLCRFEIRNFKCIEYASLDWQDLIVLIGENNAGKSSVLSAIAVFLSGSAIKDASLFRRHQIEEPNAIELVGHFDGLTDEEMNQVAVRGRMDGDRWVLKKKYWFEPGAEGEAGGWKEQLFSFSGVEQFAGWPDADTTWVAFPADYQPLIDALANKGARPTVASREALRTAVREHRPDLLTVSPASWVPNPGGGGNWKSNANSILPRPIFVRAVQEASDETNAKDASTYGKLVNLIVERSLAQRPEMARLQSALDEVLALFRPDPANPQRQAQEVRDLQDRINQSLNEVVGGQALIRTESPELRTMVLPSTSLVIRDAQAGIDTEVGHQGHGLQRTLVITLLQLLADAQIQGAPAGPGLQRGTILLIEEPELYLHPQMERLMRDVLQRLAAQPSTQVACCTHSPVFLDIANQYRSIVRMFKTAQGDASCHQVTQNLFPGAQNQQDKQRLNTVARFDPTVNELFFAKRVVLMEEFSAMAAFERAAELMGLFQRHQRLRREVALVDCNGKPNIPAFLRVLNAFNIPYRVLHDEDPGNPAAQAINQQVLALLPLGAAQVHKVAPDLEGLLGYQAPGKNKPYVAVCTVENLHSQGQLPAAFQEAVCMAYFGQLMEPAPVA